MYAAVNGILDVFHSVHARVCDKDELVGLFVKPLLNARVVAALLWSHRLFLVVVVVVVNIAHGPLRDILGRLWCGGRCLGRRRRRSVRNFVRVLANDVFSLVAWSVSILRAAGEAKPGTSDEVESWRANEPYGLLSSSSHILSRAILVVLSAPMLCARL
jgi:hypothetical protein